MKPHSLPVTINPAVLQVHRKSPTPPTPTPISTRTHLNVKTRILTPQVTIYSLCYPSVRSNHTSTPHPGLLVIDPARMDLLNGFLVQHDVFPVLGEMDATPDFRDSLAKLRLSSLPWFFFSSFFFHFSFSPSAHTLDEIALLRTIYPASPSHRMTFWGGKGGGEGKGEKGKGKLTK